MMPYLYFHFRLSYQAKFIKKTILITNYKENTPKDTQKTQK